MPAQVVTIEKLSHRERSKKVRDDLKPTGGTLKQKGVVHGPVPSIFSPLDGNTSQVVTRLLCFVANKI
jgi:hypothetical protein